MREGLIGAAFAILVILLFLFSIRSTLVTAISIPLSIIIALIGLWVGNYSLNVLTLGGLTIAVGRVIDDSIVVLENIYRHMRSGEDKRAAVLTGVREVAGAVTASTITTVAVFLPIAFTTGLVGEFFQPFSIAVTIALLASLFVALTIIPVLAYWFLKVPGSKAAQGYGEKPSILERGYVPLLRWVTQHRAITLTVALLLLVGTFALYPLLETNLFGSSAQNTFSISLQEPVGSSLDLTNQAALKVEKVLAGTSGIQNYQATVGSGGSAFSLSSNSTNQASFAVTTNANADQNTVQQQVRDQLKVLPNIGTITLSTSQQTGSTSSIAVNVQASNDQTLRQAAQQVYNAVAQTPNLTDVTSSLTDAVPLIDVHVDSQKAINHGMTPAQVGQLLRSIYTGTTVTQVTLNGVQQDVDLKLGTPATTVKGIQDMLIPTATGNVRLGDLADVTLTSGPTQITHIATNRTATINATVTSQNVGAVSTDVQNRVNKLSLPSGASVSLGGVTSQQSSAFQSLGLALLAAILLVYIVMVGTFRSLLTPLILLVAIPFAGTGSIALLLITHTALGLPSLIGLLMLIGIVVTNAIVLLDLVNQYRKRGLSAREAVIEGGRRRLRPILMTAIATILALIPMSLSLSGSSSFLSGPLAIVVIGGLASSTVLTLLIVPTLYTLSRICAVTPASFLHKRRWLSRGSRRRNLYSICTINQWGRVPVDTLPHWYSSSSVFMYRVWDRGAIYKPVALHKPIRKVYIGKRAYKSRPYIMIFRRVATQTMARRPGAKPGPASPHRKARTRSGWRRQAPSGAGGYLQPCSGRRRNDQAPSGPPDRYLSGLLMAHTMLSASVRVPSRVCRRST